MKNLAYSFLRTLVVLIVPFLLIIASISLLTSDAFVSYEYAKPVFPADPYGFTLRERLAHAADNLRYIRQNLPATFLQQQTHAGNPLYNSREISHMRDVQGVFQGTFTGGTLLLVLFVAISGALAWHKEHREEWLTGLQRGGFLSALLVAVIGLLALVSWNGWFTTFHQLFFQPGTWTFEASDTLIRLFPLPFWFDGALTVSALTFLGGIAVALLGTVLKCRVNLSANR